MKKFKIIKGEKINLKMPDNELRYGPPPCSCCGEPMELPWTRQFCDECEEIIHKTLKNKRK